MLSRDGWSGSTTAFRGHPGPSTTARAGRAHTTVRFGGNFPKNLLASPNGNTPATMSAQPWGEP